MIFGVPWDNGDAFVFSTMSGSTATPIAGSEKASKALLLAATSNSWWRDTATERVWVKVYGENSFDTPSGIYNAGMDHNRPFRIATT
jgi:hypothetical protein